MTLDLSQIEFSYDFFSTFMPDGSTLILNKVNEDFIATDGTETAIKRINIVIAPVDGSDNIICSSVIGIGNDYLLLSSGYSNYLGNVLTEDNIKYCTLELYENE